MTIEDLLAPANLAALKHGPPLRGPAFARLLEWVPTPGAQADWGTLFDALPALAPLARTPQDAVHHGEGDV